VFELSRAATLGLPDGMASAVNECAICIEPFSNCVDLRAFNCLHTFCASCIDRLDYVKDAHHQKTTWKKCPVCRACTDMPRGARSLPRNIWFVLSKGIA
jgi:hypothetical protein